MSKLKGVLLEAGAIDHGDISFAEIDELVDLTVYENTTEDDKYEHIGDAEVVFVNKVIMDEELFEKCPNIKYVGVCATGYNVVDLEAARKRGVVVTNVPAYSTDSVVQHTWALLLEIACNVASHDESVKKGDWIKSETFCYWKNPSMELSGKTMGIVGYGNIGSKVARIALDFGMKVLVFTAHPEKYANEENVVFAGMDEVFANSDIVSLHCPLTDETEKIIKKENIDKMKEGVIIINVSRGGLVNEVDLAQALECGKVKAAAVDVVSVEPMKEDNPLFKAKNILITPHMAWASVEARTRLVNVVADNYKNFLKGIRVNVVN